MRSTSSATDGGVAFAGPLDLAYRANLESRLASRVLWRVAHGGYRNEADLYALVQRVDWPTLFDAKRTLRVDVAATRSPLASLEFATLKVKDAVCDRFREACGVRPSVDKRRPDVRVHAFLAEREATLYLDTSGEALFKRGYRRDAEGAPLRENLAAGIVALSRWAPGAPLLDPMCGGGTIAIEAAMIAADRAPGLARTFGFQKLAWFDGPAWQRLRQRAHDRVRADSGWRRNLRERHRCASDRAGACERGARRRRRLDRLRRRRRAAARRTCSERRAAREPAVRRASRRRRGAGSVLSEARRRAEAALRRLEGVSSSPGTRASRS